MSKTAQKRLRMRMEAEPTPTPSLEHLLQLLVERIADEVVRRLPPPPAPREPDKGLEKLPALVTVPEAARLLRRSTRALRRWEQLGLLRMVRPNGGRPLVERAELERILREGRG